ncbi:hypothetical protein BSKO_06328 [Bryopsis sp. KO-2023]|nr:hypothetical protein BSKO_06328 [Bryopsis sp. KO-2023]
MLENDIPTHGGEEAGQGRRPDVHPRLMKLFEELRELDTLGLLESQSANDGEQLLSSLRTKVHDGIAGVSDVATAVRRVCESTIWTEFKKNRQVAEHADRLLDHLNNTVRSLEDRDVPVVPERPRAKPTILTPPVNELLRLSFEPRLLRTLADATDARALLVLVQEGKDAPNRNDWTSFGPNVSPRPSKRSKPDGGGARDLKRRRTVSEGAAEQEVVFCSEFQKLLARTLRKGLGLQDRKETEEEAALFPKLDKASEYCAQQISSKQVTETILEQGINLSGFCDSLDDGVFDSLQSALRSLSTVLSFQLNSRQLSPSTPGIRLSKIKGACDQFVGAVSECAEGIMEAYLKFVDGFGGGRGGLGKEGSPNLFGERTRFLPASIEKNTEPYYQGDWQRVPHETREYECLSSYEVREDSESMLAKLKTVRTEGCAEEFRGNHKNALKEDLEKVEQALVHAVSERQVLCLGEDIAEVDTWGMDCYTRKNVHDAILEAGVFKRDTEGVGVLPTTEEEKPDLKSIEDCNSRVAETTTEESRVAKWVEEVLMPAVNKQGSEGWDMHAALNWIIDQKSSEIDTHAGSAIKARLNRVGYNYFRLHPKGQGVICSRSEGIPAFRCVEEYLGVLHTPWRWFEIQDALKKYTGDDVPDFYNIVLERPRDDPDGYDVMFVDAAAKGSVASRMSHSCNPNCQAVVLSCKGRLTIAVYTTRKIESGEELTFDYSSVTESEKEYRAAICFCGTHCCRGSFLYYAGSSAFMQVMNGHHTFLHRNVLLLKAATEPLNEEDHKRLQRNGLRSAALGRVGVDRVPEWLEKWVALCLEYVEKERTQLPAELLRLPANLAQYTPEQAEAQAKGVSENRLQNIVITLDKIKLSLRQPGQPSGPPLIFLSETEVIDYLWKGEKSIAKRAGRGVLMAVLPATLGQSLVHLKPAEVAKFEAKHGKEHPYAVKLCKMLLKDLNSVEEIRKALLAMEKDLREEDMNSGGGHTACADILHLYAKTERFFVPEKNYKGFTTAPLEIPLRSLSGVNLKKTHAGQGAQPANDVSSTAPEHTPKFTAKNSSLDLNTRGMKWIDEDNILLSKKYSVHFIWGQLVMWFKQTVNDPTASLSADRRGTLSLPDIESCYSSGRARYASKDRGIMLEQIEKRPDAMWKFGSMFSFRNEHKVYGSPMFDSMWRGEAIGGEGGLKTLVEELKNAPVPVCTTKRQSSTRGKRGS